MRICPKCGTQYYGDLCPKCYPYYQRKKPFYTKWWFWLIAILVIFGFLTNVDEISSEDIKAVYTNSDTSKTIVEETLLYSGNDIKIFAKGLKGNTLNLFIENNSNLNLGINAHSYAVNGIMTKESVYSLDCDVSAHSKSNTKLKISNLFLSEHEIESIEQIDILFWAYDNDKSFKEFETEVVTIKTSDFDSGVKKISGKEIYNKKGMQVDFLRREENRFIFCLTNTTGTYFDFSVENININGYTDSDWYLDLYSEQVLNNCQYVFEVNPDSDFLSINAIKNISNISFNFEIEPMGDAFKDWDTEKIVYNDR